MTIVPSYTFLSVALACEQVNGCFVTLYHIIADASGPLDGYDVTVTRDDRQSTSSFASEADARAFFATCVTLASRASAVAH